MDNQGNTFLKRKTQPIVKALKNGTTVKELAFTLALGSMVGVLPVFGVTTVILLFISMQWKLNVLVVQAVNYAVYPLQFILYIPFMRLGHLLHPVENTPQSVSDFLDLASKGWMVALSCFGVATFWAVVAWLVVSVPVGYIVYFIGKTVLSRVNRSN